MLAYVELEQLRCDRQSDGDDGSNPYLWVELLQIDDDTLSSADPVSAISPASPNSEEIVVMPNMHGGDAFGTPDEISHFATRFRSGLSRRELIVVAALWDQRDTPLDAVAAGYDAFLGQVHDSVADHLLELASSDQATVDQAIAEVKSEVHDKVYDAIAEHLSTFDEVQIGLGLENPDRFIDSAFQSWSLAELTDTMGFTLPFKDGDAANPSDQYEVAGELLVQVDPCEDQLLAVDEEAQNIVQIEAAMKQLGQDHHGELTQADEEMLEQLEQELADAKAKLKGLEFALARCREGIVPVGPPVGPIEE